MEKSLYLVLQIMTNIWSREFLCSTLLKNYFDLDINVPGSYHKKQNMMFQMNVSRILFLLLLQLRIWFNQSKSISNLDLQKYVYKYYSKWNGFYADFAPRHCHFLKAMKFHGKKFFLLTITPRINYNNYNWTVLYIISFWFLFACSLSSAVVPNHCLLV
jgi:hypothetical protein